MTPSITACPPTIKSCCVVYFLFFDKDITLSKKSLFKNKKRNTPEYFDILVYSVS